MTKAMDIVKAHFTLIFLSCIIGALLLTGVIAPEKVVEWLDLIFNSVTKWTL